MPRNSVTATNYRIPTTFNTDATLGVVENSARRYRTLSVVTNDDTESRVVDGARDVVGCVLTAVELHRGHVTYSEGQERLEVITDGRIMKKMKC